MKSFLAVLALLLAPPAVGQTKIHPDMIGPVTSTGGTTARALRDWMADIRTVQGPTWDAATTPILIAHRGTQNISAPENTIAAMDYAAALGVVLETDVQRTLDGVAILLHDESGATSTTRTTGVGLDPALSTYDQIRALDAAATFNPTIFSPQRIPTFEEYLRRYGRTHLLLPEVKTNNPTLAREMAQTIVRLGLVDTVAVQSFHEANLLAVKAVDSRIKTVWLGNDPVPIATAVAQGYWGVFISSSTITAQYTSDAHAAGLKVMVWTADDIAKIERVLAMGVDGIASNDPPLLLQATKYTPQGTTVVGVPYNFIGSGWRPYNASGWTPTISGGVVTWTGYGTVGDSNFSVFRLPAIRLSAALATTQTITTSVKVVAGPTSGAQTTQFGIRFCWTNDGDIGINGDANSSGYYFVYKLNGTVEITRISAGVPTYAIGTATWAAIAAGQTIPLRIDLTATTVTVTRTDNAQTVSVTNSTHPRTGFVGVFGQGVVPGIGQTTVTY